MSSNNKSNLSATAKNALHNFKMETAREIGVTLNEGYNGDLSSKDNGYVGGYMVKRLIEQAERQMASSQTGKTTR